MKKPTNISADSAVVIVFGRTAESKVARGARFRIEDREKALAAAIERNFELIMAFDEETRRLAEELQEGRFAVNGRAQLPTIASALYDRLRALSATLSEEHGVLEEALKFASATCEDRKSPADAFDAVCGPDKLPEEPSIGSAVSAEDPAASSSASPIGAAEARAPADAGNSEPKQDNGAGPSEGFAAEAPGRPADGAQAEGAPAKTGEAIAPALIVFGRTGIARPRAGWHPLIEAGLAHKAAERQGLLSLPILTPEEFQIASQIGRGRLFGHGTLFVPTVPLALFDKLVQLYGKACGEGRKDVEQGRESAGPRLPKSWAEIGVGSLVLAPEENDEGWWEAEALAIAGDELALRWRLDPNEPVFIRKLTQVALLNPAGSAKAPT